MAPPRWLLLAAALSPAHTDAATLRVCPEDCVYRLPSAAVAAARDGDVVSIAGHTYVDCLVVAPTLTNLRIVGERGAAMTGKV